MGLDVPGGLIFGGLHPMSFPEMTTQLLSSIKYRGSVSHHQSSLFLVVLHSLSFKSHSCSVGRSLV